MLHLTFVLTHAMWSGRCLRLYGQRGCKGCWTSNSLLAVLTRDVCSEVIGEES